MSPEVTERVSLKWYMVNLGSPYAHGSIELRRLSAREGEALSDAFLIGCTTDHLGNLVIDRGDFRVPIPQRASFSENGYAEKKARGDEKDVLERVLRYFEENLPMDPEKFHSPIWNRNMQKSIHPTALESLEKGARLYRFNYNGSHNSYFPVPQKVIYGEQASGSLNGTVLGRGGGSRPKRRIRRKTLT